MDTYQLDIGKSAVDGQQSFVRVIFEGLTEHRPGISQDIERDYYLFWKTDSADERVPEFEDEGIRDQVLASWKMVQARKLAKDKAEKLADEARKSGKSLGASIGKLPDVEVSKAGPFSWMTTGACRRRCIATSRDSARWSMSSWPARTSCGRFTI